MIIEYRILLPLTVEEFERAHLYTVQECAKLETGGGEGVEYVVSEPSQPDDKEQKARGIAVRTHYTHKIWHLASKVPGFIRLLAPKGSLEIHEKCWNYHPQVRTELSNPDYMKDGFHIIFDSVYADDRGDQENVFQFSDEKLTQRTVIFIDIAKDPVSAEDYVASEDPTLFKSSATGRGTLQKDWSETASPIMCCYKVMDVSFKWWGLQTKVESVIKRAMTRALLHLHRRLFCWMDKWYGLTMKEVRELENKTKMELETMRSEGDIRGMQEK